MNTGSRGEPAPEPGGLAAEEVTRYARHILLPEIGRAGQERLRAARVLVVGAGGLGSPVLLYLAAAGVGTLGIVDDDVVELTNLQRQVVHDTAAIGRPKVYSARERVAAVNPAVAVRTHPVRLDVDSAAALLADYDVVVDGADNFPTRYAVAAAAASHGIPHIWGSVYRFAGQVSVWAPPSGPCYACVFPTPPPAEAAPSCAVGGVFGAVCGAVGSVLATEVIKWLTGVGEPLVGRLLVHDALAMTFETVPVRAHPLCPVCRGDRSVPAPVPEASPAVPTPPEVSAPEVSVAEATRLLSGPVPPLLIDIREAGEREIVTIPGDVWLPLADLALGSLGERLGPDREVILYCKTGSRSAQAVVQLRAAGVRARSLAGGVLAWAEQVDPSLPTY